MRNAIKIADRLHPDSDIHWVFDNSQCHDCLSLDALTITKMNIGPGRKNTPHMHQTIIPANNPHGFAGQIQDMQFPEYLPDGYCYKEFEGKLKGIDVILTERGLIPEKLIKEPKPPKGTKQARPRKLRRKKGDPPLPPVPKPLKRIIGECQLCKQKKACKPHLQTLSKEEIWRIDTEEDRNDTEEEEERPSDCCMQRMLSLQADFQAEKSLLEQVRILVSQFMCIIVSFLLISFYSR
jgi:hypothetical protein